MPATFTFLLATALPLLFLSSSAFGCPCTGNGILDCVVSNSFQQLNTTTCLSLSTFTQIRITYDGNAVLSLITGSTIPVVILPKNDTNNHTLQITGLSTNASLLDITIRLSNNQLRVPLFSASSSFTAPSTTLSVTIVQLISAIGSFTVFGSISSSTIVIANYEIIISEDSPVSGGVLNLANLLSGLQSVDTISISGTYQLLSAASATMPFLNSVKELSLNTLRLSDPLINYFTNLKSFSVEECQYNRGAQFLNFTGVYNLTLLMENNNALDGILPNGDATFVGLTEFIGMTFIERQLNSAYIRALARAQRPRTVLLDLGAYQQSDLQYYMQYRPTVYDLTIRNILSLDSFPSSFFNQFDALRNVTLQGTFTLPKSSICIFSRMRLPQPPIYPFINLDSTAKYSNGWDVCANIYITAMNQPTTVFYCQPNNTVADCQRWAAQAANCSIPTYEMTQCQGSFLTDGERFTYNNSYLNTFLTSCLTGGQGSGNNGNPTDSLSIYPIIGALCGLLVAITVLTLTIFFIRRRRRREALKYLSTGPSAPPGEKQLTDLNDFSHISIATSKTSKSLYPVLKDANFSPMQPNYEIAPPLYTAPSEAANSVSPYKMTSGPATRRDSSATQATHIYETVDS